ncbi:MAG: pyridoxal-phosphate dependent enzyme, partial [Thermodesulfobacteriota bacterium]
ALGGNKCRKLEYVLAKAEQDGIDTLITSGSSQSNFALQMAAAAGRLGMEAHLMLITGLHNEIQGNLLLHSILGSKVTILDITDPGDMFSVVPEKMQELAAELQARGRKPLVVPAGALSPLGTAGWVSAAQEIHDQLQDLEIEMATTVLANGSGGTQAGLALGFANLGRKTEVLGISVLNEKDQALEVLSDQGRKTTGLLGLKATVSRNEWRVQDDYLGPGYGLPTPECLQAIHLVAKTEAVYLDPVYTGKAMAGLIDLIRKGRFTSRDNVLFIHTGGAAANFAYQQELVQATR